MAYNLIIKPEAEIELIEILDWYEKIDSSLGLKFYKELGRQLMRIEENPYLFQKKYKDFRVIYTEKFNYGIHFTIAINTVYIHAILHTKRLPRI